MKKPVRSRKEAVRGKEGTIFMEKFSDNIKKIILAGIGAVAVTAEKSKDLLDEMVAKGELTVEQGKVLNEELKHNIKKNNERPDGTGESVFRGGDPGSS